MAKQLRKHKVVYLRQNHRKQVTAWKSVLSQSAEILTEKPPDKKKFK